MKIGILAVDIETSGSSILKHGIIAIGYCLGDNKGNVIIKKRIHVKLDTGKIFEKRCMETFWNKNLDKLEILKQNAKEPKNAITEFINDIDSFEDEYDLRIITDNASFDIGFLNYYLELYLDRLPLSYKKDQKTYRPIYDTDSYARGVLLLKYDNEWIYDS